jgi:type II secretory ATPase GspE/PulE/Tfp pilus assembly ATPase PilB-like protein
MNKYEQLEAHEIVDAVLTEAAERHASDIYFLPETSRCTVGFKLDGVQEISAILPSGVGQQCVTRLKVMAQMLTYRNHIAQDGVIVDNSRFGNVEFRVAAMPTINGERVTVRLQDRSSTPQTLDELGFSTETLTVLKKMLSRSGGMIVLTGPTGCGKTTTIYAMVRELLKNHRDPASIIAIEDPVECRIEGITQVSLSRCGEEWDYPHALRAALRQDVKTLVVGEMRDREVVKVALDAALTGHLVISTFHAGDIPSVYGRILHQGFEPFLVAAALSGIVTQRLLSPPNGGRRIPVAAYFEPDDAWRDFIAGKPSLAAIRDRLTTCPGADLQTVARSMAETGLISNKEAYLI